MPSTHGYAGADCATLYASLNRYGPKLALIWIHKSYFEKRQVRNTCMGLESFMISSSGSQKKEVSQISSPWVVKLSKSIYITRVLILIFFPQI